MSAKAEKLYPIPRNVKPKNERSLVAVSSQPDSSQEYEMPARTADEKLDRLMEAMTAQAQATTALAQTMAQKNGKTFTERAGMWMPTLVTMLILGVSVVQREQNTKVSLGDTQAQVINLQQRNNELWQLIETQRLRIDKLDKELAIANDREARRK